jgi:hypothetical protein
MVDAIRRLDVGLRSIELVEFSDEPEIMIIGKQLTVALASATRPLRKPGAETVMAMPGFLVR